MRPIKSHFFITAVHTKTDSFKSEYNVKDKRCWGYTDTIKKAMEAVLKNYSDYHETMYQWMVIEENYMAPLAFSSHNIWWFHWDKKKRKYGRCETPKWAKNISNWGIG